MSGGVRGGSGDPTPLLDFPKLLRCMLTTVGSAPFAILQLSAVWY